MKRKLLVIISTFILVLTLFFSLGSTKVFAAEKKASSFDTVIQAEVENYVRNGKLASWHLNYYKNSSYQTFYYKMVKMRDGTGIDYFATLSQNQIATYSSWYSHAQDETWEYILANLDIDPEYLEPDKYLGLYWDSYAYDNPNLGYLYLIWTSRYLPSEFVTITQFKESNKVYNLYDSKKDQDDLNMNWYDSTYYHIKDYDLSLHITPIGGMETSGQFGIELKQSYNFQGFTYGLDKGQYLTDPDPGDVTFGGSCKEEMQFDLGLTPKNDGHNVMQLCTHAYEYITDIEAQSYYDMAFGGYMHMVHFNLSINPDQIYRVDTKYTISNTNKEWYQFWLPEDSHTILKSLTPDKSRGGILGLFNYQGFKEGSFSSVSNPDKKYKYELLLDYDDKAWLWTIFTGQEYKESDYRKIDEFKILRINYLLEDKTYDVQIKMDTIEGDTYNILSPNLIESESSVQHKVKTWTNDVIETIQEKVNDYKVWLYVALGAVGAFLLLFAIIKVRMFFRTLMTRPRYYDDYRDPYYHDPRDDRDRRR